MRVILRAEDVNSVRRKLIISSILLLAAMIVPIAAYAPDYINKDSQDIWFQRSGSIIVILSAISEYTMFKITNHVSPALYSKPFDTPKWYSVAYIIISIVGVITLIIGTLIWGYGDYIYQAVNN